MKKGICKNISIEQANELLSDKKVVVIDVRDRSEYNLGHVRNSINIPVVELNNEIERYVKNKNVSILLYCSTGSRSTAACQILIKKGYKKVYNVYHGIKI